MVWSFAHVVHYKRPHRNSPPVRRSRVGLLVPSTCRIGFDGFRTENSSRDEGNGVDDSDEAPLVRYSTAAVFQHRLIISFSSKGNQ